MVYKRILLESDHDDLSLEMKYAGEDKIFPETQIKYWIFVRELDLE